MRAVIGLLLLANLLLFAWWQMQPEPGPEPSPRPPALGPGVAALRLLSERPAAAVEAGRPPAVEPETVAETEPGGTGTETAIEPEAPVSPTDEQGTGAPAAEAPSPAPVPQIASAPPAQPVCSTIGPFDTREAAEALAAELGGRGLEVEMRMTYSREPAGYWVFLPVKDRHAGQAAAERLVAAGVKDYFVGPDFVSLGIFRDRAAAERRDRELRAMGYETRMERRFRKREVYWLDVREPAQLRLAAEDWAALQATHPDVQRQVNDCE
ncbi:SPOR domain-containing protein [Thiohalobacter sp.]|uniref:SPOR domain-containing protein n=1 Tax=Thiohalobacter sp. TaxID=2025948 RepID=UPI002639CF65|nr:SPOR domain-containing protein [Thiohalobacter sp.]